RAKSIGTDRIIEKIGELNREASGLGRVSRRRQRLRDRIAHKHAVSRVALDRWAEGGAAHIVEYAVRLARLHMALELDDKIGISRRGERLAVEYGFFDSRVVRGVLVGGVRRR